jgi:hypothetical protein
MIDITECGYTYLCELGRLHLQEWRVSKLRETACNLRLSNARGTNLGEKASYN